MARKHVLDAHALVWYLEGNPRLGAGAKAVLDDPARQLVLPMLALAEAVDVVGKGKSSIRAVSSLLGRLQTDSRIDLAPLTWDVFQHSLGLTVFPDIHDRLIVATALYLQDQGHTVVLLTKDTAIQGSGLIPIVW